MPRLDLLGMSVIGAVAAMVGFFLGGPLWIAGGAIIGAAIGGIIGRLGGRRFFLSILVGATLGALLWIVIGGNDEAAFLGAAVGAAMGAFLGVNLELYWGRR